MYFRPLRARPARIAVLGNALPRRCGLATYTSHSVEALRLRFPDIAVDHYAMDDGFGDRYGPDVTATIDAQDVSAFVRAAAQIQRSGADILWLHHEFGIFGGKAGDNILTLLRHIHIPVVATLHTVLADPDPDQLRVMKDIIAKADRLIVMARTAAEILRSVYKVDVARIDIIPHGAPDRPLVPARQMREKLDLEPGPMVLTFGLLSPGKGIETAIRSLPAVVKRFPTLRYLILGATHPALVRREGEAYRDTLFAMACDLGMEDNVTFVDRFVGNDELLDYLQAADIYLTPYLGRQQVTSGTLSYALAMGRPVVSTPYIHAEEALAHGIGTLVPFGDSGAISEALIDLLSSPQKLAEQSSRVWRAARSTIWEQNAMAVMKSLSEAGADSPVSFPERHAIAEHARVTLEGVAAMTDDVGIIQHSICGVPDRHHGYCLDDNVRALKLVCETRAGDPAERQRLARTYAAFVDHAWDRGRRCFRNFMGYDRTWLEAEGSQDSSGRTIWVLGQVMYKAPQPWLRRWAECLFSQALPVVHGFASPRSIAFAMLGCAAALEADPDNATCRTFLGESAAQFRALMEQARRPGWSWFEIVLTYDNARLPQALIEAGRVLGDGETVEVGLSTLRWLLEKQRAPLGHFRPVGTDSFTLPYADPRPFDQQPLEAVATIDACASAYRVKPDGFWIEQAIRASSWFEGENDLAQPLSTEDGTLCYDGLTPQGVNLNMGAESILALQQARHAMAVLLAATESEPHLSAVG
ncbi:MAG: glycosyltransferase [Sphingobium sp.]|nr:glycosyltransferase [Sphingobium sp.]